MAEERRSSGSLNGEFPTSPPAHGVPTCTESEGASKPQGLDEQYQSLLKQPSCLEKKFSVDRRKLERLILYGKKDGGSAEKYFNNIMASTGTVILWPSKLKIGAKSKKDPQVKVCGTSEAISAARDLILADLDTKSSRVTLKINIANSEHSHVIGKEGVNIKKVSEDTNCHIHFPDSHRHSRGEKGDQVSIMGLLPAVEVARSKVRDLQPIFVTISLPLPGHVTLDSSSPDMQNICQTYNVQINIKPQPQNMSINIMLRGTVKFVDGLKIAINKVVEYFTGDFQIVPQVTLFVDVAEQHHNTIYGREGGNVRRIMDETATIIQFPDPQARYRSSQIIIMGTLDNVLQARQMLQGCLPVALLFDVQDDGGSITSSVTGDLMQSLDLFISIKSKAKQNAPQSVIVKSIEQNMECVYEARHKLIDIASNKLHPLCPTQEDHVTSPEIPTDNKLIKEESSITDLTPANESINEPALVGYSPPLPPVTESPMIGYTPPPPPNSYATQLPVLIPEVEVESEKTGDGEITMPGSLSPSNSYNRGGSSRLTVKAFMNYEKKKEDAKTAMKTKVEADKERYPTDKWSGELFSRSMPQAQRDLSSSLNTGATPKGLESLNKSGFKALLKQASSERKQAVVQEQNLYKDITDLYTLLSRLGLEKYWTNFSEEEVDLETFLTMNEDDLKEVGVQTLGARRKLQLAIGEIRKLQSPQSSVQQPPKSSVTHRPPPFKTSSTSMSRSVRF